MRLGYIELNFWLRFDTLMDVMHLHTLLWVSFNAIWNLLMADDVSLCQLFRDVTLVCL